LEGGTLHPTDVDTQPSSMVVASLLQAQREFERFDALVFLVFLQIQSNKSIRFVRAE
jgi:hypothetical protein